MTDDLDEVRVRFRSWARAVDSMPIGSGWGRAVLADDEVARIMLAAPPEQRLPVLLIAAAHHLLLGGDPHELHGWYPTCVDEPRTDDPVSAIIDFCHERHDDLTALVADRQVQTNEVGRCAIFLPAIARLATTVGPIGLVDVGTSAGLNLHLDRYGYRWGDQTFQPGSSVQLTCDVTGPVPVPTRPPPIAWRAGLDHSPVDVTDDGAVDWLRACTWADEPGRLTRLEAAVRVARRTPERIVTGDAVADVADLIVWADDHGHPVVTTCWVMNYLTREERVAYVAELDGVGRERDLTWLFAESPDRTSGLPHPVDGREDRTVLTAVTWRNGVRDVRRLAVAHPHGRWMLWDESSPTA